MEKNVLGGQALDIPRNIPLFDTDQLYELGYTDANGLFDPYITENPILDDFDALSKTEKEFFGSLADSSFLGEEELVRQHTILKQGQSASEKAPRRRHTLNPEDQEALEKEIEAGNEAHQSIFYSYLRLASWFTRESMGFHRQTHNKKVTSPVKSVFTKGSMIQDLSSAPIGYGERFQAASIGLYEAIRRWDPEKGMLTTFAMYHMEARLISEIANLSFEYSVYIPADKRYAIKRLKDLDNDAKDKNSTANAEDIAYEIGLPLDEDKPRPDAVSIECLSRTLLRFSGMSLDEITDKETSGGVDDYIDFEEYDLRQNICLADTIRAVGDQADFEAALEEADFIEMLLSSLDTRDREVLSLRFGLDRGEPRTLEEVGDHFGFTRERVRQIEARAMSKIRHMPRFDKYKDCAKGSSDDYSAIREQVAPKGLVCTGLDMGVEQVKLDYSNSSKYRVRDRTNKFSYIEDWTE